jgi:hypothetical protein
MAMPPTITINRADLRAAVESWYLRGAAAAAGPDPVAKPSDESLETLWNLLAQQPVEA